MIRLSAPDITDLEVRAVVEVLRTPDLSLGPRLAEFEEAFARRLGVPHAVAVSSGTAGLHLCMRALDLGPGDEVITTPFSFVASVNCFLYEGSRPVFADIDEETLNLDPAAVAAAVTPRTRAILPVHVFGLPCAMGPLMEVARGQRLEVVEDACEAFGARVGARPMPLVGRAAVYAFYPNKQITTGEGGMVVTADTGMAALLRSLRNQGRSADGGWLAHERLGYNYRLDEIRSALGLAQLARADAILEARSRVAGWYEERLASVPRVTAPPERVGETRRGWFVYVVLLESGVDRD
ncbi:MAG: DegT/DnrJ/EryC1/StrS family aminotransferase, partial [Planctomycetes bacterium]|nr:DegT/DnrJ/EryC1/StrS family aminotransferase [Planctomycetota bacterium]